jgi:hypothetical protein
MTTELTTYERNKKEQSEALGLFVQAFERMVDEARNRCTSILIDGLIGNTLGPAGPSFRHVSNHQLELAAIPLHHQTLTSKPIFDIFRALFISTINEPDYQARHSLTIKDVQNFASVLATISTHYENLGHKRNNLLHGTWHFSWWFREVDPAISTFFVQRRVVTKTGLIQVDLPKTPAELLDLCRQCDEVRDWIEKLWLCLPHRPKPRRQPKKEFKNCFEFTGGKWVSLWTSQRKPLAT